MNNQHYIFIGPIFSTINWGGQTVQSVVPKMPLDDLLDSSSCVFIGTAVRLNEFAFDEEATPARSEVLITVDQTLLGTAGEGTTALPLPDAFYRRNPFADADGAPRFQAGEEYLVFVRKGQWYLTPLTDRDRPLLMTISEEFEAYWARQGNVITDVAGEHKKTSPSPTDRDSAQSHGKSVRRLYDFTIEDVVERLVDGETKEHTEKNRGAIVDALKWYIGEYEEIGKRSKNAKKQFSRASNG